MSKVIQSIFFLKDDQIRSYVRLQVFSQDYYVWFCKLFDQIWKGRLFECAFFLFNQAHLSSKTSWKTWPSARPVSNAVNCGAFVSQWQLLYRILIAIKFVRFAIIEALIFLTVLHDEFLPTWCFKDPLFNLDDFMLLAYGMFAIKGCRKIIFLETIENMAMILCDF